MKLPAALFTATFVSTVTAGWALLGAGADVDGPARQPALREATIGGRKVAVVVDRDRVPVGETVHVTLALEGARHEEPGVDVKVRVLEQTGSPMSRSMPPPREVQTQIVHLGAAPSNLAIALDGEAAGPGQDAVRVAGKATQYTVIVSAAKDLDGAAAVPVFAYRPEAYHLTIDAPAPGKAGEPVAVTIHVKNVAAAELTAIRIGLSSNFISTDESPLVASLAPGAETTVVVHGKRTAPAGTEPMVQASGWAGYGGTSAAWITVDPATGAIAARGERSIGSPFDLVGG